MSTIRYFENVPHIVRYGMQDDKKEKSSMTFWRSGVGFVIEVSHEDVRGTAFSKKWLKYLKEPNSFEPSLAPNQWVHRWDALCDCILSQCMSMLKELAPGPAAWVTLNDYLHTPSYNLRMVTNEVTKDAVPKITEGPNDTPSYEHWPTAAANIKHLPLNAPRLHAEDLISLDQGIDWRHPPGKVRAVDARVFSFKACKKTSRNMDDGTMTMVNSSVDIINVYSRLYKKTPNNIHIPRMEGVVITAPSLDIKDSSPTAGWIEESAAKDHSQQRQDDILIAGILLTCVDNSKPLADLLKSGGKKPTTDKREKWRNQIREAVDFLHGQYITIGGRGGRNPWHYINGYTVRIVGNGSDTYGDAWLSLEAGGTSHDHGRLEEFSDAQTKFDEERAMDLKGIEKLFDF